MIINNPINSFEEINSIFQSISGNHGGMINNKIYQVSLSDTDVSYYALTADFPEYQRVLAKHEKEVAYHLSGYGITREEALIRLIGEAVERFSSVFTFEMLKYNMIYKSYRELKKTNQRLMDIKYLNVYNTDKFSFVEKVDESDVIGWYEATSLIDNEPILLPGQILFLNYHNDLFYEKRAYYGFSTGTATHSNYEDAINNALIEYLQIDSFILFWYQNNLKFPRVKLDDKLKQFIKKNQLVSDECELLVIDLSMDKPITIYGIFIISSEYPYISFGVQGGGDPVHTLYRGLLEAATIRQYAFSSMIYDEENMEKFKDESNPFLDLDTNVLYWASDMDLQQRKNFLYNKIEGEVQISDMIPDMESSTYLKIINYCSRNNFTPCITEITAPEAKDIGMFTMRVIIPELLPMCLPAMPFQKHPRMKEIGSFFYEYPHPMP